MKALSVEAAGHVGGLVQAQSDRLASVAHAQMEGRASSRAALTWFSLACCMFDLIVILLALTVSAGGMHHNLYLLGSVGIVVWLAASNALSVYESSRIVRPGYQIARLTATLIATMVLLAGTLSLTSQDLPPSFFASYVLLSACGLIGSRLTVVLSARRAMPSEQRVLMVGTGPLARVLAQSLRTSRLGQSRARLVGFVQVVQWEQHEQSDETEPVLGTVDSLQNLIVEHDIQEVIISLPAEEAHRTDTLVRAAQSRAAGVLVAPDVVEITSARTEIESLGGIPLVRIRDLAADSVGEAGKRLFDIVASAALLVALAPLMGLICFAILLEDKWPIIYRQERIGQYGHRFMMYKFRTMRPDLRKRQVSIPFEDRRRSFKSDRDPRVTRLGRLLRRTCLDELPQLLNVFKGEMSLVGPRPEQPEMLGHYRPEHFQRHLVLPGVTGWWQINSRCQRRGSVEPERDLQQKLLDDLHYLRHRSFQFDLRVLLETIHVVLSRRGAI